MLTLTSLAITPMTSASLKKVIESKNIKVKTMKNILLIWDENPEQIKLYNVKTDDQTVIDLLIKANGKYINGSDDLSGVNEVNMMLAKYELNEHDREWIAELGMNPAHVGILADSLIDDSVPFIPDAPIDLVIKCGFIL